MARLVKLEEAIGAELVAYLGGDDLIARAATVSTGKDLSDDARKQLVGGLARARHAVPFEFCVFVMKVKAPVGILTQLLRHRMVAAVQASTRYGNITYEALETGDELIDASMLAILERLQSLSMDKRTREIKNMSLPRGLVAEAMVKVDLRGFSNVARLRIDKRSEKEIRLLAEAMLAEIAKTECPVALAALAEQGWNL